MLFLGDEQKQIQDLICVILRLQSTLSDFRAERFSPDYVLREDQDDE